MKLAKKDTRPASLRDWEPGDKTQMIPTACRLDRHQICAFAPAQRQYILLCLVLHVLNYLWRTTVRIVSLRWKVWKVLQNIRLWYIFWILFIHYFTVADFLKTLCLQSCLRMDPVQFLETPSSMQIWILLPVYSWVNFLMSWGLWNVSDARNVVLWR